MFHRPVRSALFVDFDNIAQVVNGSKSIGSWLSWLEDGQFDENRRLRSLVIKRVYWNTQNEVHRDAFVQAGFSAFNCPSRIVAKKSAADMLIALEALEVAVKQDDLDEFIILTSDTDFVPLIAKLSELNFSTAIVADEQSNQAFGVYQDLAEFAIPKYRLRTAPKYEASRWSLAQRMFPSLREKVLRKLATSSNETGAVDNKKSPQGGAKGHKPKPAVQLDELRKKAARTVVNIAETSPSGPMLAKKTIISKLHRAVGQSQFDKNGGFLGYGGYPKMMVGLSKIEPKIKVKQLRGGGVTVTVSAG